MKIENGLLFVAAQQLSDDPRSHGVAGAVYSCVPIRNISHMKEHPHRGKVYTVLHLDNGDEIIADATIPKLILLITEAQVMNLFGNVPFRGFQNPEVVIKGSDIIKGSDLKVVLERQAKRNEAPTSFAKGGMIPPGMYPDAMV